MYTISKEFHFSASHVLHGLEDGHPCGRLHGHNYVIIVELQSQSLNETGFVKDYRELDPIKKFIDEELDHKHLNDILDPFLIEGRDRVLPLFPGNPSAENMARALFHVFQYLVPDVKISAVTVKETPKTAARYERN
jgi:6-pyruvoyltetrahydropterin/6-carboxytetrahydropterin synthase